MFYQVDLTTAFDWRYLIVFLVGIIIGFIFVLLVYVYSLLVSIKKKRKYKREPVVVDEREVEILIGIAQEKFKDKEQRKDTGLMTHFKNVNLELSTDIAKKYYPDSKYPLLELTVEETLELTNYISNRINGYLSRRLISKIKGLTWANVMIVFDTKTKADELKENKKASSNKFFGKIKGATSWVKSKTVDKLVDLVVVKMFLPPIGIIGEETYKIYSKSVFQDPEDLTINVDELYGDI